MENHEMSLSEDLNEALDSRNLTKHQIGERYNSIDDLLREVIDAAIAGNSAKIVVIQYLRRALGLGLTQAKNLYEARERFLTNTNEYGFIK